MINDPLPSPAPADEVEAGLRAHAPALPPALRNKTLSSCAARAAAHEQRRARWHWRLVGAASLVLLIQWVSLQAVDAQNTHLIAGNGAPPLCASLSPSEFHELWRQRSRQIAQLMEPKPLG